MAKILLIEDEKAMSDLVAIKFRVEGFEVDQAFTFAQAREKITAGHFEAILTDFLLPDGDLVDFLGLVRSDPARQNLPIVVMTNYVEDLNQEQLKSLGVAEVIVKYQVVPAQMVEKIKHLLGVVGGPAPTPMSAPPITPVAPAQLVPQAVPVVDSTKTGQGDGS